MKKSELKQMIKEELLNDAFDSKTDLLNKIEYILTGEVAYKVISRSEMKEILKAVEKILA